MSKDHQYYSNEIRKELGITAKSTSPKGLRKDELQALADAFDADYDDEDTNAELRAAILRANGSAGTTDVDVPSGFDKLHKSNLLEELRNH